MEMGGSSATPTWSNKKMGTFTKQRNPPEHVLKLTRDHYLIC